MLVLVMKSTDFYSSPIDNHKNVFLEVSDGMGSRAVVKLHTPEVAYIALEISRSSRLGKFKGLFSRILRTLKESGVKIISGGVDVDLEGGQNSALLL